MDTSELKDKSKSEMRKVIRGYRDQMQPEDVEKGSSLVLKRVFSLPEFIDARRVLFYMSFRNEVDTGRMVVRSMQIGKEISLPKIIVEPNDLDIYDIKNLEKDTTSGILGIMEPSANASKRTDLSEIDLCIVPGIVFDRSGHRIGWGRGFYDNFFSRLPSHTKKFGLGYDYQLVEKIEANDRDVPLDGLVTESAVLRFSSD